MPANEIHKNDIGTVFKVTIKDSAAVVNVSTATTKQIILKKPSGTKLTKDASFFTDGSDGIITYTTVRGNVEVARLYCFDWWKYVLYRHIHL